MPTRLLALFAALGLGACSHAGGGLARGPSGPRELPANLRIKGTPEFRGKALSALLRLRESSTGRRLLKKLSRTGRTVVIRHGRLDLAGAMSIPTGQGDSAIVWNPDYDLPDFPAFLGLHHELVHALHEARGEALPGKAEEARAIGAGKFASSKISENALRRELGLPLREEHGSAQSWVRGRGVQLE